MTLLYSCEAAVTEAEVIAQGCSCSLDNLPATITVEDLIDSATDTLAQISFGTVTGRCTTVVRPCSDWGGVCGSCEMEGIPLEGFQPSVSEVKIDGVVLATTDYAMLNGYKLVRTDGSYWPGSKNPVLPDTEDNTFSITYEFGVPHDFVAKNAVIELVCEMAAQLTGEQTRLPKGTVSATADGVQIVIGRMPGMEEITAVGLTWLGKFLAMYGGGSNVTIQSPELREGWTLHTIAFNA